MKKLKSVSLLLALTLGLTAVAYRQKETVGGAAGPGAENSAVSQTAAKDTAAPEPVSVNYQKCSVYSNPIDEYFLPRMEKPHISMVEFRFLQACYQKAWKDEFEHLVEWMKAKCVYEEDKKCIASWKKSVEKDIKASQKVIVTELLDVYEVDPDPEKVKDHVSRVTAWGNGTACRLKQLEGESYRNAVMQIADLFTDRKYSFRKIDYSKIAP